GRGDVKVLDFGLARSLSFDTRDDGVPAPAVAVSHDDATIDIHDIDATRPATARDITGWTALPTAAGADFRSHTGSISGTIAYMSPEQAIGESPAAPSDMYSFGLMLQEMLTGQP